MDRHHALKKLHELKGQDLRKLAEEYQITVWKEGRLNKGWAGLTVERYLGLSPNSSRDPNFGSWELKLVSLKRVGDQVKVKETMAICMINVDHIVSSAFEQSHLFSKLRRLVVVGRIVSNCEETESRVFAVGTFDLEQDARLYRAIKEDYEAVRALLTREGFHELTGKMGRVIQPRTKGPGHGSTSRAFYARKNLVAYILGIGGAEILGDALA